jgi:hypothetical protein
VSMKFLFAAVLGSLLVIYLRGYLRGTGGVADSVSSVAAPPALARNPRACRDLSHPGTD